MCTNYYKLKNISLTAIEEEISTALKQSTLSGALVEKIKRILQNKSLKNQYDEDLKQYEASESKKDYEISNITLDREIKKVKAYDHGKTLVENRQKIRMVSRTTSPLTALILKFPIF